MTVENIDILVVDDQKSICYSLVRLFEDNDYTADSVLSGEEALAYFKNHEPGVVVMDIRMTGMNGLEVLGIMKQQYPKIQVVMMTAYSTYDQAIEAIKLGAYDYLIKPFENDKLLALIHDAYRAKSMLEEVVVCDGEGDLSSGERIVGNSPIMLEIFKKIGKIAATDAPVLILGDSGTGKELIARAVFNHSQRTDKPFLVVDCASIPENLLESELFGYERGSFTGADHKRIGRIEQCSGGTLFLDEIGELPVSLQVKLLRVLQDGSFQRIGGSETISADFRLLAATNRDLESLIAQKQFREDLYYRINTVIVQLPSLRNRLDDIPALTNYFMQRYRKKLKKNIKGISEESLKLLQQHSWPGNIRELENLIHKSVILSKKEYLHISEDDLRGKQPELNCTSTTDAIDALADLVFEKGIQGQFQTTMGLIETAIIKKAMEETGENQVQAAKLLGISRNTLRKKLSLSTSYNSKP